MSRLGHARLGRLSSYGPQARRGAAGSCRDFRVLGLMADHIAPETIGAGGLAPGLPSRRSQDGAPRRSRRLETAAAGMMSIAILPMLVGQAKADNINNFPPLDAAQAEAAAMVSLAFTNGVIDGPDEPRLSILTLLELMEVYDGVTLTTPTPTPAFEILYTPPGGTDPVYVI